MKLRNFNKARLRRGITLIEILIVLGILGFILTIIVTNIDTDDIDSRKANLEMKTDLTKIKFALFEYKSNNGSYPDPSEGLRALVDVDESGRSYLKENDILDPYKNEYQLLVEDSKYRIISLGADRKEGGEGVNSDIDLENLP